MSRERFAELNSPEPIAQRMVTAGTIVIGVGFNGAGKDKYLMALANASSGRYVEVTGRTQLEGLAADIWKDLRNRYLLGFVPTTFDGKEHTLSVKVKRTDVIVRARAAYLAPKPP